MTDWAAVEKIHGSEFTAVLKRNEEAQLARRHGPNEVFKEHLKMMLNSLENGTVVAGAIVAVVNTRGHLTEIDGSSFTLCVGHPKNADAVKKAIEFLYENRDGVYDPRRAAYCDLKEE